MAEDGTPAGPRSDVNITLIHRWSFVDHSDGPQQNPGYDGAPGETNKQLVRHALAQTRSRVHIVHAQLGDVYPSLEECGELTGHDGRALRLHVVDIDAPADLSKIRTPPRVGSDELLVLVLRKPWTPATKPWQRQAPGRKERQPGMVRHSSAEVNKQASLILRFLSEHFGTDANRLWVVGVPPQLGRLEHDLRRRGLTVAHPSGLNDPAAVTYPKDLFEWQTNSKVRSTAYEAAMYLVETSGRDMLRALSSLFTTGRISTTPPEFDDSIVGSVGPSDTGQSSAAGGLGLPGARFE